MTGGKFTPTTDDIIVQEGTFGFSFVASGIISGGALVKVAGPMQVTEATNAIDNAIGVAHATVAKGDAVTVYPMGNIIRSCCCSATTMGDDLFVGLDGCFDNSLTYGGVYPCVGIALESAAAGGTARILLK